MSEKITVGFLEQNPIVSITQDKLKLQGVNTTNINRNNLPETLPDFIWLMTGKDRDQREQIMRVNEIVHSFSPENRPLVLISIPRIQTAMLDETQKLVFELLAGSGININIVATPDKELPDFKSLIAA